MGRSSKNHRHSAAKSHTLPSSPTHSFSSSSSSSSDFEFTISLSPHKSGAALCPADELFYKGQLLPLHLSPRLSMVRTLLLSSPSTSSYSDTTTTASRDSTASRSSDSSSTDLLHHHDCDSSRPSSVADDEFKRLCTNTATSTSNLNSFNFHSRKSSKYFSLSNFSSVFRKNPAPASSGAAAVKRVSSSAKDVIRKYLKKVKPLYEKLSQKQQQKMSPPPPPPSKLKKPTNPTKDKDEEPKKRLKYPPENTSFSGNLVYPRRRSSVSSCPSSIGSSPSHGRNGFGFSKTGRSGSGTCRSDSSSMEELQSAIQSAIVHCKNSMLQHKNTISDEI